jgi:sugar O-acyltransferase (sialic acid O-acetyltransferase NeuD family)
MSAGIIIYGGGGHAKVVLDTIQQCGRCAAGIIDTKFHGDLFGVRRFATIPPEHLGAPVVIAIGDNSVRKRLSLSLQGPYTNVIHPTALVSPHSFFSDGVMMLHRSVVQAGTKIGNHVIINTAAQIDHDCVVADFAHLGPGSILCGNIEIGEGTLVGAGAVIKPGVKVGAWVTIGSGAVIVKDIPDFAVVVGNPGKIIKYIHT